MESGCLEKDTYRGEFEDYVTYWKNVAKELDNPIPLTPRKLQLDFWSSITYIITNASMYDAVQEDSAPKDDFRDPL